ncbi:MAG: hypothetical protein J0L52_03845 [Caulobacterales bacterium]|nr:hypothetical protein [Caulobacterales bacterium]
MGLFDFLTGNRSAPSGVARVSVEELRARLLAHNRDTSPWQVRDGAPEGVDLVAEWRIVDAAWYEIFARAGLEKVFQVLMKFDAARGEVRAVDREWTVQWTAGVPSLSLATSGFRGQKTEVSFGTAYAFREEDLSYGKVYEYRFNTAEIKEPIRETVLANGWGWKGVAFSKL